MGQYRRRNYFIDKNFQTRFILKFSAVVIMATFVVGLAILYFSRDFTTVTIENAKVSVKTTPELIMPIIVETIIIVNCAVALLVVVMTMLTSHSIAGPLFRIKREIGVLKEGDLRANFKIRKTDQLQDLATSLTDLADSLRGRYLLIKDKALELKTLLDKPSHDTESIRKRLSELEDILNQYKI
jgi:methyl-accepting chemotaxis protein